MNAKTDRQPERTENKIDVKKMIIYSEILKPKFQEMDELERKQNKY
ncbi:MAG: hypothetical protein IJS07_05255 [Bacteroidales bacterium]|nr:hypothetical protein [Bacteroidales bacterium]